MLVELNDLAPYSVTALREAPGAVAPESDLSISQSDGVTVLENALLRVEIDAAGDLISRLRQAGSPRGDRGGRNCQQADRL